MYTVILLCSHYSKTDMDHLVLLIQYVLYCFILTAFSGHIFSGDTPWLQDDCEEIKTTECPAGYAAIRAVKKNEVISQSSDYNRLKRL